MRADTPPPAGYRARPGRCFLVGAGPGDPELLTLKAVRAIASATLLLVDDLVNPEVLVHAAPGARVLRVGKRGGCHSTSQRFIHQLMVMAAHEGETVVRLKGGDPCIFGRAGEEIEHLRAEGIDVEVVNGITAGLAGLSSLGAPLTHRDHAQGVLFITGHSAREAPALDWADIATLAHRACTTLVIYMGVAQLSTVQHGLLVGLPADTPVAVVQNASLPTQREVLTVLADLTCAVAQAGLQSPSVIVVGDVVKLTSAWRHELLQRVPQRCAG